MKKIDVFAAVNVALFLVLCVFRYYPRFIHYRGPEHIEEFFVYAAVILAGIALLWRLFRHFEFPAALLIGLQVGIVMHFSGAFVRIDAGRLYDAYVLGIRYDKYVHFVNSLVVCALADRVFDFQRIPRTRITGLLVMLVTLGLGAVVEIVEYLVVLTIPDNGVGGYDNNMQDLIANLVGGVTYVVVRRLLDHRAGRLATTPSVDR